MATKTSVVHNERGCKHGIGCGNTDWDATTCKNCLKLMPADAAPQDAAPPQATTDICYESTGLHSHCRAPIGECEHTAPQDEMPPAVDPETLCDDPVGCTKVGTNHVERPNEPTDLLRCDEHVPPPEPVDYAEAELRTLAAEMMKPIEYEEIEPHTIDAHSRSRNAPQSKDGWLESNLRDPEFKTLYDKALVDQAPHLVGNARQRRKARRAAERAARGAL